MREMFHVVVKHSAERLGLTGRTGVSSTPPEDQIRVLLRARQHGEAFDLAMKIFGDRMLRLAVSMLGDRALAEDTVQDVMIRIWRALPSFRSDAAISTWIYAITRNRCLTVLKSRGADPSISLDEPRIRHAAEYRVSAPPATPCRADRADIVALVSALPTHYRQPLTLFYMGEKSYEDIARMLGLPIGTVKTRIHRAKKMLAAGYHRE
jgi:RNA polymerase sigma-70 factor (ECF subfamily)